MLDGNIRINGDGLLHVGEDNVITWGGMVDRSTGALVNGATVTVDVVDDQGDSVAESVSIAYVTGSHGDYRGKIGALVAELMADGSWYQVSLSAVSGARTGYRSEPVRACNHGLVQWT